MKINDKDLRLTILGCFRYSLPRTTYMPSHTVKMIKDHQKLFTKPDWERFVREVDDCINFGDAVNKQTWQEFRQFAVEKFKEEEK